MRGSFAPAVTPVVEDGSVVKREALEPAMHPALRWRSVTVWTMTVMVLWMMASAALASLSVGRERRSVEGAYGENAMHLSPRRSAVMERTMTAMAK